MKLIDKQIVEATKPTIYVGRRTYKNKRTGEVRIAKPYWAEYFTNGRQYQEPLGASNKAAAIRAAYTLAERLERGQQKVRDRRRTIEELADTYHDFCKGRGRARKTLVKYKGQLKRFKQWCKTEGVRRARAFSPDDLFAYRTYLSEQCGLSEKSIYNETIVIKQLFKWAEWMGHSSSAILDMYFTMNDRHAQAAMNSMSFDGTQTENRTVLGQSGTHFQKALPQPTHL